LTTDFEILQAVAAGSLDGVTIADCSLPDHPLIFVNLAFERMTGYSFEEINRKNCRFLQAQDTGQEDQLERLRIAIKHSQPCLATLRNYRKDGSLFWNELNLSPIFGAEGQLTHYLGIQKEITEKVFLEEKLRKNDERYTFAMKATGQGLWDWNLTTAKVHYSPRWKSILGYADNEVKDNFSEWQSLIHPDDEDAALSTLDEFLNNKANEYRSEFRMQHKDGRYIHILSRAFSVENEAGEITRLVGTHADITEHKKANEALKLAASVFTHAREGIVITNAAGAIIEVNSTFTKITGYNSEDILGQEPRMLQSPNRHSAEFYAAMSREIRDCGTWTGETWNQRKDGREYPALLTRSAVTNDAGEISHYVAHFSDITQIKTHQTQLEQMAHYDALTRLPNRTLLTDRMRQAIIESQRNDTSLAVAFLDLDDFKAVNDTHGHTVGDELLIIVSQRMKEALREGDTLARIGGDEFIAVLAGLAQINDYQRVLERLLLAASETVTVGEIVLQISASIGVTLYHQDDTDGDTLLRHADQAMYCAKEAGKNQYYVFDTAHDGAVNIRRESLGNIRASLDRREFVLFYQPQVNMSTGEVVGVEALIRWQHPARGLVTPLDFLPIIEGHAISLDIGEWVIDTALRQISHWKSIGITLTISVNISAYQLQQANFVTRLSTLLAAHPDVSPSYLELEVLETSALSDINHATATMNACIDLGVNFALDDFGTGYSSLTYLRRLPTNLIKIDQSFIRDMLIDTDDLAIVEGIISLAKAFQREVIAEGVETIEHGTALLEMGCHLAQGYGIAKPMPANDIPAWLNVWKPDDAWRSVDVK
jgi:diguanylate cyclase (GGDEF)-like protein/PAS domain S-box-containing protein